MHTLDVLMTMAQIYRRFRHTVRLPVPVYLRLEVLKRYVLHREVFASKQMVYSDSVRSTFLLRETLPEGRHHSEATVSDVIRLLSISRLLQKAFFAFNDSASFEGLLHKTCSICDGPNFSSGPKSDSQSKDVRLS